MLWYDLVLLLVLLGSMLAGFARGFLLQAISLVALYLGLSVASAYQPRISRFMSRVLGPTDTLIRDAVVFFLIVLAVWGLINLAVRYGFRETSLRFGGTLDRLAGLALGMITGFFWALVLTIALSFMTSVPWPNYNAIREFVRAGIGHSFLVPLIITAVPYVAQLVSPWVSGYLPPIFFQSLP